MLALAIVLGVMLGIAALLFLTMIAMLISAVIFFIEPRLRQHWSAIPFDVLWAHAISKARPLNDSVPESAAPVLVVLCKDPLDDPRYLVGQVERRLVFTPTKTEAKRLALGDLAIRQWMHVMQEHHGITDIFVCYGHPANPSASSQRLRRRDDSAPVNREPIAGYYVGERVETENFREVL